MPFDSLFKKLFQLAFYDEISATYNRNVRSVESDYNSTSSVTLRVVEGDEKRTLCLGV
jgi:hypothetical protein